MSNFPPNDGLVNQPGQPGPYPSAPGQHQQQPLDPRQQEMQEFLVGILI